MERNEKFLPPVKESQIQKMKKVKKEVREESRNNPKV
ncbi:hypothetical protein F8M41_015940, partial [Gigaspora margarita]